VAELAFGLPALGAVLVSVLRNRRGPPVVAGLAFGLAGLLATSLVVPGQRDRVLGVDAMLLAPEQVVLVATFLAAGLAVLLVPPGADRVPMLASVLIGLSAIAAVAILTQPLVVALLVLVLAAVQSAVPALRSFADRVRAPAFGALLIALGAVLAIGASSSSLVRVAGLALVVGVAATIGVAPYLQRLDPREPAPASPIAWLGFFGPALAVVLVTRFVGLLPAESGPGSRKTQPTVTASGSGVVRAIRISVETSPSRKRAYSHSRSRTRTRRSLVVTAQPDSERPTRVTGSASTPPSASRPGAS